MTMIPDNALADGIAKNSIKIIIKNANNNSVSGINIDMNATNQAIITSINTVTASDATVTVTLNSLFVGISPVNAKVNNSPIVTKGIQFVVGAPSTTVSTITSLSPTIVNGGKQSSVIALSLMNENSHPIWGRFYTSTS